MFSVFECIGREHDLRLVALAAAICLIGCFASVNLLARAQAVPARSCLSWLAAAAAVFGCSVWSMHFIAMLAFIPGLPIAYDVRMTASSIAIAIVGALIALTAWRLLPSRSLSVILAGAILGLSVSGMHYMGVAAMRLPGHLAFQQGYVVASVVISLVFGMISLARAIGADTVLRQFEVSAWLAIGICGLHFTGMTGLIIFPGTPAAAPGTVLGSGALATAVVSVSSAVLIVCLAGTLMEKRLAERKVEELSRLRVLSNLAQEVIMILRDGIVLEVNSAGVRLFGRPADAIIGRPVATLFAEESVPALLRRIDAPERHVDWPGEIEVLTVTGKRVAVEITCETIEFRSKPAVAMALLDLTERKRDAARIRHLAYHDALTDLPGRLLLHEQLRRAIDTAAQRGSQGHETACVAALLLNLDRFKPLNDVVGHVGGDSVLREVARRIIVRIDPTDFLARIGGDEFVVVLPDAPNPAKVYGFASRLIEALSVPFLLEGEQVSVGASIGIALSPVDGTNPEALLRAAQSAMHRVKAEAPGTARFFEPAVDADLHARHVLEQELRHAVERGEMELFFQPLVNCHTGGIDGFETLLRWRHPRHGLISPGVFIPIAEESGFVARIGEWVIEQACARAALWAEPYQVSVNVAASQFRNGDLPRMVAAALSRSGLPPGRLELEITESAFIEDTEAVVGVLRRMQALGVHLALDDFGTGFSSLSYLRLFPFDKVKIDQSFVPDIGHSAAATTIVNAIIALCHNLGLSVLVEGVETQQQLEVLRALGCDQVQGYLLGRPAPEEMMGPAQLEHIKALLFRPHPAAPEQTPAPAEAAAAPLTRVERLA
jgi:diguanylate cyclase (GGDEF)-like protein/PAS domain S-box-containing protein